MISDVSDPITGHDWIAVDLDGTLAHYVSFRGALEIGEPVPAMVDHVKGWIAAGRKVLIHTARVSPHVMDGRDPVKVKQAIASWCSKHIGAVLPITCLKYHGIAEFYDDRAYHVVKNTGFIVRPSQDFP